MVTLDVCINGSTNHTDTEHWCWKALELLVRKRYFFDLPYRRKIEKTFLWSAVLRECEMWDCLTSQSGSQTTWLALQPNRGQLLTCILASWLVKKLAPHSSQYCRSEGDISDFPAVGENNLPMTTHSRIGALKVLEE